MSIGPAAPQMTMYVSNQHPYITDKDYLWKLLCLLPSTLRIHPLDKLYRPGRFYLSVYGSGSAVNTYRFVIGLSKPSKFME